MNRRLVSMVSATALLIVLGTSSAAHAQERRRYWAGIAVGVGSLDASSFPDGGSRDTAGVVVFNVGWWLHQRWQFGFDCSVPDIDSIANLGAPASTASFAATAAFYPNQASGFYLKGGAGGSAVFVDIVDEFGTKATAFSAGGPALMAGTGWDFYLGRRFWLTPAVTYRLQPSRRSVDGWTNSRRQLELQRHRFHDRRAFRLRLRLPSGVTDEAPHRVQTRATCRSSREVNGVIGSRGRSSSLAASRCDEPREMWHSTAA